MLKGRKSWNSFLSCNKWDLKNAVTWLKSSVAPAALLLIYECLTAKLVRSLMGGELNPLHKMNLLPWCGAWPEDGSTQLWFGLLWSLLCVSIRLLMDMLYPMMDRDVSRLRSATQCRSLGWLGAWSFCCSPTFKHAEPVNHGIPRSAHESTADQQNHSWHMLAVNTKHNLTNSYLGKWMRKMPAVSEYTSRQIYTNPLNDCSNFAIALK